MWNEINQLEEWFKNFKPLADGGILIVDSGSTDGSIEYCKEQGAIVIVDDIIQREGYGSARNHLREMTKRNFSNAHWMMYLDADERIDPNDFHYLRHLKDYLIPNFDVIALPRIDWMSEDKEEMAKDFKIFPDYQSRMTRLTSPLMYVRKLHEQIQNSSATFARITNPKINHFHRSAGQEKRDVIGKLCAKLHMEDDQYGHTMPEHPKEAMYREMYEKEGL